MAGSRLGGVARWLGGVARWLGGVREEHLLPATAPDICCRPMAAGCCLYHWLLETNVDFASVELRRRPWLIDHALENPLEVAGEGVGGADWQESCMAPVGAGVWDFSGGMPRMLGRADDPDNPFNTVPPVPREYVVLPSPYNLGARRAAPHTAMPSARLAARL